MSWLATYAGFGLPRAELFAQQRADSWGWCIPDRASVYREGATSPVPRALPA